MVKPSKQRAVPSRGPATRGRRDSGGRLSDTSWDGASSASEEADKLDREGAAWVNPTDAQEAGVTTGALVTLQNGSHSITIKVKLDDGVAAGTVYVPSYYRGGAVMSLFDFEGLAGGLPSVKLIAANA